MKYINRHFYSITHAHIHSYTKHIMYSMLFFRKRKKREKWKDLCCYFITQILIALWKREPKRKVFSLFFLFTFYLRWIESLLVGLAPSRHSPFWLARLLNVKHYVTGDYGRISFIWKCYTCNFKVKCTSTMGNLFAAGEKRASAHALA